MSSSLLAAVQRARGRFHRDVADQLRMAAGKAGLAATVRLEDDRAVLECGVAGSDGAALRIVATFSQPMNMDAGASEEMSVHVETGGEQETLLTAGWRDDPGLDEEGAWERRLAELNARTDERLPLERRGLNAAADVRTGRYAKGDAIRQLAADLKGASPQTAPAPEASHALVTVARPRPVVTRAPDRAERSRDARPARQAPPEGSIGTQRANASEFLISSLMQAMQRELAEAESHFVGPGVAASARGRLGRVMEWAMLGTAYGVEAKTNQIAVSSFLGDGAASWLYGLVGPVLIGGLAALSRSKAGKGAAYGLLMSWALAMASITASNQGYLERAQGYFPKQAVVMTHEQAVGAARIRKAAAEGELKRLSAALREASELLAEAENRWQAAEIRRAAEHEGARREKDRAKARQAVIDAGLLLNEEELRLREALLNDPSRAWAWATLFAIFAVINLAGPLAIARVLEQWRADHSQAEASAREGHKKKSEAALLRGSRSAQKARAMLLLPALLDDLKRGGAGPEVIAGLDLADISQKAAERFDRGVNAKRAARGFFGLRGPAEGPG